MHPLKYDSVHGRWKGNLDCEWSHSRDIEKLDWRDCDVVLECTGAFPTTVKKHKHILTTEQKKLL